MIAIPYQVNDKSMSLIVILEGDNVDLITPWMEQGKVDKVFSHLSKGWAFNRLNKLERKLK